MNKPEYSDLYKFIVSLGVILIASAILLPWLFLHESFDTHISASDIANLTQTAQTLIEYRQNTALWFVQNIIWISLIPALSGSLSLFGGLFLWQRKQKLLDRKDVLETEKLKLEIENMTPEQIAVKAIKETVRGIQEDLTEETLRTETTGQVIAIQEYFRTEDIVINKLTNCFGSASVHAHQKVGSSEVDILVRISNKDRVIFEVKRAKNPSVINRQRRRMVEYLSRAVQSYSDIAPGRKVYGIGIIIVGDNYFETEHIEHQEEFSTKVINDIAITTMVFKESEFIRLECTELKTMVKNI